jgi:hypothetical protein
VEQGLQAFILSLVQQTDGYEALPKTNGRAIAYQAIDTLKYTNQYVFSWEVISTQFKKAYDHLEEMGSLSR